MIKKAKKPYRLGPRISRVRELIPHIGLFLKVIHLMSFLVILLSVTVNNVNTRGPF